jgi:hypothetical protein
VNSTAACLDCSLSCPPRTFLHHSPNSPAVSKVRENHFLTGFYNHRLCFAGDICTQCNADLQIPQCKEELQSLLDAPGSRVTRTLWGFRPNSCRAGAGYGCRYRSMSVFPAAEARACAWRQESSRWCRTVSSPVCCHRPGAAFVRPTVAANTGGSGPMIWQASQQTGAPRCWCSRPVGCLRNRKKCQREDSRSSVHG